MQRKGNSLLIWGCILMALLVWGAPPVAFADGTSTDPPVEPPTPPDPDPTPPPAPDDTTSEDSGELTTQDIVWVVIDSLL